MKKTVLLIFILISVLTISLVFVGCSKSEIDLSDMVKVTYELEGGVFQNCEGSFSHFYTLPESGEMLIYSPESLSNRTPSRSRYTFGGWFKTKSGQGDSAIYSNEWDFATDTIGSQGVTLYAKWIPDVKHTYEVCYLSDNNEKVSLGFYNNVAGQKFDDWKPYASKRIGYTALGFMDKDGKVWDDDFVHPGGEEDTNIEVYVKYIKGSYTIVKTAQELLKSVKKDANIYLDADIDCGGEPLKFNNYRATFVGNGHTVSNFTVFYSALATDLDDNNFAYASILGNTTKATVTDVTFDQVKLNYSSLLTKTFEIYIAPLSVNMEKTTLRNVHVKNMTIVIEKIPSNMTMDRVTIVSDKLFFSKDSETNVTDCTIENITVEINVKTEE